MACSPLSIQPSRPQLGTLSRRPPGVPARRGGCCNPQSSGRGGRPPTDAPFADPPKSSLRAAPAAASSPPAQSAGGGGRRLACSKGRWVFSQAPSLLSSAAGGPAAPPAGGRRDDATRGRLGFLPRSLVCVSVQPWGAGGLPSLSTLVGGAVSVQGALHALQVFLLRDRQHRRQDLVLVPVRQTERGRRHLLHDGPALQGRVQGH